MRVPDEKIVDVVKLAFKRYARGNVAASDYAATRKAFLVGAALGVASMDGAFKVIESLSQIDKDIGFGEP